MSRITAAWRGLTNLERFMWRNMFWGVLALLLGWGENNYFLIGLAIVLIYIPGILVEFIGAFGKDLSDRLKKQELEAYRKRFEG